VSPDGRELWTASAEDGMISVIDLAAKKLTTKIDAKVFGANRLNLQLMARWHLLQASEPANSPFMMRIHMRIEAIESWARCSRNSNGSGWLDVPLLRAHRIIM
jgi:hypothetical protein